MKITQKDVEYVASLANLELSPTEREGLEKDLNSILDYIDMLAEVDTGNVGPMSEIQTTSGNENAVDSLRDDESRSSLSRELALNNAPQSDGSFFRVPKVIER
jgi:aspartyl-tRNA(Asn)/glutamyl-tRNA(Gln) amidotransferase subunit C